MPKIVKSSNALYIGIDPGGSGGGLALLSSQEVVEAVAMPKTERDLWDKLESWSLLARNSGKMKTYAVIERVHSMPSQSAQSGFSFGLNYGQCRLALIALGIPFDDPAPQTWMKALNIPSSLSGAKKAEKKEKLRAKAQQLFPELPIWKQPKSKGIQLAICDALLIAHYCRLTRR